MEWYVAPCEDSLPADCARWMSSAMVAGGLAPGEMKGDDEMYLSSAARSFVPAAHR